MATKKKKYYVYDILPKPQKGKPIYPEMIRINQQNVHNMRYRFDLMKAQERQNKAHEKGITINDMIESQFGIRHSNPVDKQIPKNI